jgi:hypothetical protein
MEELTMSNELNEFMNTYEINNGNYSDLPYYDEPIADMFVELASEEC